MMTKKATSVFWNITSLLLLRAIIEVRGQPCGGVIRNTTGTLSAIDRDGDGYYDSGMNCMWFVHAPINDYISVQVLFMDILLSDNCQMDFLEIIDGREVYGPLCGDVTPPTVMSRRNVILFRFKSSQTNATQVGRGFLLEYQHHIELMSTTLSKATETKWESTTRSSDLSTVSKTEDSGTSTNTLSTTCGPIPVILVLIAYA